MGAAAQLPADALEPLVELAVDHAEWDRALPDLNAIATNVANAALEAQALSADSFAVSVLATDDDRIAALNLAFRGKATPTNVLSWPAFDLMPGTPGANPPQPQGGLVPGRTPLGDVALSFETCTREANAAELPLKNHVTHLILHGILHLLGFDHQTDADAGRMEEIERAVLHGFGIADPYA